MAVQQTMLINLRQWLPNQPCTNPNILHTYLENRQSLRHFLSSQSSLPKNNSKNKRLGLKCRVTYSTDEFNHNNNSYGHYDRLVAAEEYPRPTEIPWKKELCNSVQLIGIVGAPVQSKQLASGKALAWSRLAVKKSSTETAWINLTFWDELAHIASQHVGKGQQIYVSGRLVSDTVDSEDGKQQTYYKVVVQQLNFIERNLSSAATYDGDYNSMASGRKLRNNAASNSTGSTEELWQAFFANPSEWWDNRKNKRSPNYPDFKHKDTGEALWVEGRYNPSWVKSQLSILDEKMEAFNNHNDSMRDKFTLL